MLWCRVWVSVGEQPARDRAALVIRNASDTRHLSVRYHRCSVADCVAHTTQARRRPVGRSQSSVGVLKKSASAALCTRYEVDTVLVGGSSGRGGGGGGSGRGRAKTLLGAGGAGKAQGGREGPRQENIPAVLLHADVPATGSRDRHDARREIPSVSQHLVRPEAW